MQTILNVSAEFQARFIEIEFIITNYFFIKSVADSKILIDSPVEDADKVLEEAMIEFKRWGGIPVSQVHEAILQGGVRNTCTIEVYSRPLKVSDMRKALEGARDKLALTASILSQHRSSNSVSTGVTELRKSSSRYDTPRSLLDSVVYGPNKDMENKFASLFDHYVSNRSSEGVV